MVLAELWLENRKRKSRAKAYEKAFAQASAEGCDEGFPLAWQRAYALGHEMAYAKGYDSARAEGFAVGYAEGAERANRRWKDWLRRREAAEAAGEVFTEPHPGR